MEPPESFSRFFVGIGKALREWNSFPYKIVLFSAVVHQKKRRPAQGQSGVWLHDYLLKMLVCDTFMKRSALPGSR